MENIFYDSVCNRAFDAHGKEYKVHERSGRKWINLDNKQVNVKSLKEKFLIRDFDDFIFLYVFNLHVRFPCPAMGYFVMKKMFDRSLTLARYFA